MDPKSGLLASESPSKEEMDVFLTILRETRNTNLYDFLNYIMAEETLMFMDVFAGETLKLPSREDTAKDLDHARIYLFVKLNQKDPGIIQRAAKKFQRRSQSITRIVGRVETLMKKGVERDGNAKGGRTGDATKGSR